jgi:two-component system response regulator MprA
MSSNLKMETHILIIEDDPEFADYLRRGLTYEGYFVEIFPNAEAGLAALRTRPTDLVILDIMLPEMDGMMACRKMREFGYDCPVLMLTARNAINDRITGLDAGADDYLGKPFAFDELLARLRALLRRTNFSEMVSTFADLELDAGIYAARRQGRTIPLTRTEFELLSFFLAHPGQVLERQTLVERFWSMERETSENTLDVYISRLRRKLGDPPLVRTLHGIGYVLEEGQE